jgi:hypothetical protein
MRSPGFQLTASQRWTARQQLVNFAVAVFALQRGSDAEERKVHGDGQTLHLLVPKIVSVRVVNVGECVQIHLEHVAAAQTVHGRQLVRLPTRDRAYDFRGRLARQLLLQILGAELLSPNLLRRRQIARTLGVVAIKGVNVVPSEVELFSPQQIGDVGSPLRKPLQEACKDGMGRAGVAILVDGLGQVRAIRCEFRDVGLQEQGSRSIQVIEIAIKELARQFSVKRMMGQL